MEGPRVWRQQDELRAHPQLRELDAQVDRFYDTREAAGWQLAEHHKALFERATTKTVRFMGETAIRGSNEKIEARQPATSLKEAIQQAAEGDTARRQIVRTNVGTDVQERLFKVAHQTRVTMQILDGEIEQNGFRLLDVHRNTLEQTVLIPEMLKKGGYEVGHIFTIGELYKQGVMRGYAVALFSTTSTKMTLEEKKAYGMFVDTESCAIQLFTTDDSELTLETAFVAGKQTPDGPRQDLTAIRKLAAERGIEITTDDGTEMIKHLFLIPKGEIEGVEDIVKWYDDALGGTFYGQNKVRQDYHTYAQECAERSAQFDTIVDRITDQLIAEAGAFETPLDAIYRLDYLSSRLCVEMATKNVAIDEAVFGPEAATHVRRARAFMAIGDYDQANHELRKAQETDTSNSCPLFKGMNDNGLLPNGSTSSNENETAQKKWMSCPYCRAKVYADPCAKVLSCWDCTALVSYGQVLSKGNGGKTARRSQRSSTITVMEVIKQKDQPLVAA